VWATSRLDWYCGETTWAFFRGRFWRWGFLFPLELVDIADQKKHRKGNYDETNDRVDENSVVHRDCPRRFGISEGSVWSSGRTFS